MLLFCLFNTLRVALVCPSSRNQFSSNNRLWISDQGFHNAIRDLVHLLQLQYAGLLPPWLTLLQPHTVPMQLLEWAQASKLRLKAMALFLLPWIFFPKDIHMPLIFVNFWLKYYLQIKPTLIVLHKTENLSPDQPSLILITLFTIFHSIHPSPTHVLLTY